MATILGILLISAGLVLAAGGLWLAALGGSLYYIIAGVALIVSMPKIPNGAFDLGIAKQDVQAAGAADGRDGWKADICWTTATTVV